MRPRSATMLTWQQPGVLDPLEPPSRKAPPYPNLTILRKLCLNHGKIPSPWAFDGEIIGHRSSILYGFPILPCCGLASGHPAVPPRVDVNFVLPIVTGMGGSRARTRRARSSVIHPRRFANVTSPSAM
jgi:hypothetical protein